MKIWQLPIGANFNSGKGSTTFKVWAPEKKIAIVQQDKITEMEDAGGEYRIKELPVSPGEKYSLRVNDGKLLPDPVSRFLPDGLQGQTEIIDPDTFEWTDQNWNGINKEYLILYELHIGTFNSRGQEKFVGDYDSVIKKGMYLKALGTPCVQLMPVGQFPGRYGWGYDGISLYAPHNYYGRPEQLKDLVNVLHNGGIAVSLDLVYNHVGPGGDNFLESFGPYLTSKYKTPWGKTFNFDEEDIRAVRDHIIFNALYWITEYHIDVIRLDSVDNIYDESSKHIMVEIKEEIKKLAAALGRKIVILDESDKNERKNINSNGYNHDAVYAFDFERVLRRTLTHPNEAEEAGWYIDFNVPQDLIKALGSTPFILDGTRHSRYRERKGENPKYGESAKGLPGSLFVVYSQSHDVVGNRPDGKRLTKLIHADLLKVAAACNLLSRYIPLIFMGEEFGASTPFHFFVEHSDPFFKDSVRDGRRNEAKEFGYLDWEAMPDPNDSDTFEISKLDWTELKKNKGLFNWYHDLIEFRLNYLVPEVFDPKNVRVAKYHAAAKWIAIEYEIRGKRIGIIHSVSNKEEAVTDKPFGNSTLAIVLCSSDERYDGSTKLKGQTLPEVFTLKPRTTIVGWLTDTKPEEEPVSDYAEFTNQAKEEVLSH